VLQLNHLVHSVITRGIRGSDQWYHSLSYPRVILAFLWYTNPVPTNEAMATESEQIECFSRNGGRSLSRDYTQQCYYQTYPALGSKPIKGKF